MKNKILAILSICALACVIFSGCTQNSSSESFTEQKTYTGTIKSIVFYPAGYTISSSYQIIFDDGTWMVAQKERPVERSHDNGINTIISKDVCFECLKIGHTYEMSFKKIDAQNWMLYNVKDA